MSFTLFIRFVNFKIFFHYNKDFNCNRNRIVVETQNWNRNRIIINRIFVEKLPISIQRKFEKNNKKKIERKFFVTVYCDL